jgi:hypothetical protein
VALFVQAAFPDWLSLALLGKPHDQVALFVKAASSGWQAFWLVQATKAASVACSGNFAGSVHPGTCGWRLGKAEQSLNSLLKKHTYLAIAIRGSAAPAQLPACISPHVFPSRTSISPKCKAGPDVPLHQNPIRVWSKTPFWVHLLEINMRQTPSFHNTLLGFGRPLPHPC